MSKLQRNLWFLLAVVCAVCLTVYTLSSIVTQPWHSMPGIGGDGVKNEFAYLYQIIYGRGFWFEGMNYPFGDNIVFADGQATLSVPLSYFKHLSPEGALTILWWLIGTSYILSIVYLYRILNHFRVERLMAVLFACFIGISSPQVFRITGHYGLSYICIVPMLFYWTIQFHERNTGRHAVYIYLLGIIAAFLHPYFAGLFLVWGMSYAIGYFIFIKRRPIEKGKHVLPFLAGIFGIFLTMATIMHFTDPVKDRPVAPYGILTYTTHINDIFTSFVSPIWFYVRDHHMLRDLFPFITEGGEGYTYVGLTVIFTVIISFFVWVVNVIRKKRGNGIINESTFSPIWLFMAFGALLFGMGVPYIWRMEWLLDYVSFMRQFRSLGRFSWIFYYIITIYGAVVLHRFYTAMVAGGSRIIGYTVIALSCLLWGYETSNNITYVRNVASTAKDGYDMFLSKAEPDWPSFLQQHNQKQTDFQAILMLPFFHCGSDKLWIGEIGWKLTFACKASFQLHLPMVDQLLSRTSWEQTEGQVKIIAGPYVAKPILDEVNSNKPFLLLRYTGDSIDRDQKYLLQACDYIGRYSDCDAYAFSSARQKANDARYADSIRNMLPYVRREDTCIGCKGSWFVDHLDKYGAADKLWGKGAMPAIPVDDSVVAVIPIKPAMDNEEYEFSCWFLLSDNTHASPVIYLQSFDSLGNILATDGLNTKWSTDNNKLWFRGAIYFHMKENCRSVHCKLVNLPNPSYKIMDEIQLRPADALIISKGSDGRILANNHLFPQ
jgi:hypothetical protein